MALFTLNHLEPDNESGLRVVSLTVTPDESNPSSLPIKFLGFDGMLTFTTVLANSAGLGTLDSLMNQIPVSKIEPTETFPSFVIPTIPGSSKATSSHVGFQRRLLLVRLAHALSSSRLQIQSRCR